MEVLETIHPKEDAGQALTEALRAHQRKPILLMVSGGSAFSILEFVEEFVLGPHITLIVLDERFSTDSSINNFAQLEQTGFYAMCLQKEVKTISTKVLDGESIESMCTRFDAALHAWKEEYSEGVIIGTMGIGPDGHTAGILPGEHRVNFNGDAWVVSYTVTREVSQYTDRVTVTYTFLRTYVDEAIVFVVGEEKKQYVEALQTLRSNFATTPASVFLEMKNVRLVTDSKY